MTQDEIIEMARQTQRNCEVSEDGYYIWSYEALGSFAKLVAAKEREACAKLADEYATWGGSNFYDWFKKLAAAIRVRGEA